MLLDLLALMLRLAAVVSGVFVERMPLGSLCVRLDPLPIARKDFSRRGRHQQASRGCSAQCIRRCANRLEV
jgi:hypothetical protein